jgi:non-specific serine/threonine protein kinase/serine/threonine-protein kinase
MPVLSEPAVVRRTMDRERRERLRKHFEIAGGMGPHERRSYIERELGADPELRARLEALLSASDEAREFLTIAGAPAAAIEPSHDRLDSWLGPYHLLDVLGEGGFGVVYLAEQTRPIHRRVALKVLKAGIDAKQVIARFEAERQALALMDHPNIAQVFDAGETESGVPYFVMEHVQGIAITEFCDRERLRVRDRLELFLQVCDAVHHAHQKGVIHRDIKPSNILVTQRDGRAIAKVIDFGVVKATNQKLTERSFQTREGMIVGTIGYMSPEQTGAHGGAVDTRSDIYSLGVVLYELLVGALPIEREKLAETAWLEALRVVREEDAPRLGARLSTMGASALEVAQCRGVEERTLARQLRGELEWITMRALEKDPARRYASASEFAADIRRHLANEPVSAGPPSTAYRLRKYAKRHRLGVAAAAAVLLAMIVGSVGIGIGLARARRAEQQARREAESATRVADFLVDLFETANPDRSQGAAVTVQTVLDLGARRIQGQLQQDPLVRARLLETLGQAHLSLGLYDPGIDLLRSALETTRTVLPPDDPRIARALRRTAEGLRASGRRAEVEAVIDSSIRIYEAASTPDPLGLAEAWSVKAAWLTSQKQVAPAESLIMAAIEAAEAHSRPDTTLLVRLYVAKGNVAIEKMDYVSCESAHLHALELALAHKGEMQTNVAALNLNLAKTYGFAGNWEKSALHAEAALRIARQLFPPNHAWIGIAISAQADVVQRRRDFESALALRKQAVEVFEQAHPRGHPVLAAELRWLAHAYHGDGKLDSAIVRMSEANAMYSQLHGPTYYRAGETLGFLARFKADAGALAEADSLYERATEILEAAPAGLGVGVAIVHGNRADLRMTQGRFREADTLYARAVAGCDSNLALDREFLGQFLVGHAYLRSLQGRRDEAEAVARRGASLLERSLGAEMPGAGESLLRWSAIRARAGDAAGAIEILNRAVRAGAHAGDIAKFDELHALRAREDFPTIARD